MNHDGEEVRAYEAGLKSSWLGNRLRANVAVFWNDIQGLQLSNLVVGTNPLTGAATTVTIVNNVGEARTRGVEIEVDTVLTTALRAGFTYAFTDAKALRGTEVTNGTVFGGNQLVDGAELPRSPRNSAAAFLQLTQPLARWRGLVFESRLDLTYESRRFAEIQNLIWADPRTVINLSAGIRSDRWKAMLWVKNLTNSDEAVNAFRFVDPVTFRRSAVDYLPRLRQVGGTLTYSFD